MSDLKVRPTKLKNACRMPFEAQDKPALPTALEGCGIDGGDAAFDGDAFDFDGFGEDGALEAVGQDFEDVADFGCAGWVAQNMHGFRIDLIHAHTDGEALGFFRGGFLGRGRFLGGRSRSRLALGGLFDDGLFHREIIQGKAAFAARRNSWSSSVLTFRHFRSMNLSKPNGECLRLDDPDPAVRKRVDQGVCVDL